MKLRTVSATVWLIASMAGATAVRADDLPSVDSILTKYVTALGGKTAMEKITSHILKFKLETENAGASDGEIYAKAPNKQAMRIELAGTGTILEGFDGTVAWAKSPWEGLRVKAGEELAKVKRDSDFYRDLKLKSLYPDLAVKRADKLGEEEAYVLEAKPAGSGKEQMWFSAKTGLLVRQDSEYEGPQGKVSTTLLFQDYQPVSGIQYPRKLKVKVGAGDQAFEMNLKIVEVQQNAKIDDAKFAKPAE